MARYSALQALGDMAIGAGNYFGQVNAEKIRAERLAQARAERRADFESEREIREADRLRALQEQREYDEGRTAEKREYDEAQRGSTVRASFTNADGYRVHEMQDGSMRVTDQKVDKNEGMPVSHRLTRDTRRDLEGAMKSINYDASKEAFQKMKNAEASGNHMSDTAMIFYFMKTLDPTSVVRESEFRTVKDARAFLTKSEENGVTLPTRFVQMVQSLEGEGFLTPEMRGQIMAESEGAFRAKQERADSILRSYQSTVDKYGLDPVEVGLHRYQRSSDVSVGAPSPSPSPDISDDDVMDFLKRISTE